MSGQVYAVASGKGGVGKTTTVVNLGVTLRADDRSVVLVDADLGMANLGTFLGVDHEPTLHDVLAGSASLDDALTEQVDRFAILPGARDLERFAVADPGRLGEVIEALAERYEYVLVDTGAGVGYDDILPLEFVDEVVLVTSPDPAAVGDTRKTAEISGLVDAGIRGVVVSRSGAGDDPEAVAEALGVDLLAAIPDESAVPESTAAGRPLEAYAPESGAAQGYRILAAAVTGNDVERFEPSTGDGEGGTDPDPTGAEADGPTHPEHPDESPDGRADDPGDAADEGGEASVGSGEKVGAAADETAEADGETTGAAAKQDDADVEATADDTASDDTASDGTTADGTTTDDTEPSDDAEATTGADESETEPGEAGADDVADDAGEDDREGTDGDGDDGKMDEEDVGKSGGLLSRLGGLFG